MSKIKELFMRDRAWCEQRNRVEDLEYLAADYYRLASLSYDMGDVFTGGRYSTRARHYQRLYREALSRLDEIEAQILSRPGRKMYVIEEYTDPMNDDYLIEQITKNGYLTGIKF